MQKQRRKTKLMTANCRRFFITLSTDKRQNRRNSKQQRRQGAFPQLRACKMKVLLFCVSCNSFRQVVRYTAQWPLPMPQDCNERIEISSQGEPLVAGIRGEGIDLHHHPRIMTQAGLIVSHNPMLIQSYPISPSGQGGKVGKARM